MKITRKYRIRTILWSDLSKTILININSFAWAIKLMILIFSSFTINHGILFNKSLSLFIKSKSKYHLKSIKIRKLWRFAYIEPYAPSELISS